MASQSVNSVSAAAVPIVIPDQKGDEPDLVTLFITVVGSGDPGKKLSQSSKEMGNIIHLLPRLDNGALSKLIDTFKQEHASRRAKASLEAIQSAIAECATALKNKKWDQLKALLMGNGQPSDYGSYTRKAVIGNLKKEFKDAMKDACNAKNRSGITALCEILVGDDLFFQILERCLTEKWGVEGLITMLSQDVGPDMRMIDARCKAVVEALKNDEELFRIYNTGMVPFLVKKSVSNGSSISAQEYTQMRAAFIAKFHGYCKDGKEQVVFALLKNVKKNLPSDAAQVFGQATTLAETHEKVRIVLEAHIQACIDKQKEEAKKATS